MLTTLQLSPETRYEISCGNRTEFHIFEKEDILALEASFLTGRPLLVYGEPGIGKSQLARAAARALGRQFYSMVVDSATEARDLRWREDMVGRLAKAQYIGALKEEQAKKKLADLSVKRFVSPGPLWYGFDWGSAVRQASLTSLKTVAVPATEAEGVVVLIDEIDKGESDVPNGLLEALGAREFTPPGFDEPIQAQGNPLIVITTNDERPLPPAFIRRCVVHHMKLPTERQALIAELVRRGEAHFQEGGELLRKAAEMTADDREQARQRGLRPLPGVAEYVDLLHAALSDELGKGVTAATALEQLRDYFLRKHLALKE